MTKGRKAGANYSPSGSRWPAVPCLYTSVSHPQNPHCGHPVRQLSAPWKCDTSKTTIWANPQPTVTQSPSHPLYSHKVPFSSSFWLLNRSDKIAPLIWDRGFFFPVCLIPRTFLKKIIIITTSVHFIRTALRSGVQIYLSSLELLLKFPKPLSSKQPILQCHQHVPEYLSTSLCPQSVFSTHPTTPLAHALLAKQLLSYHWPKQEIVNLLPCSSP